MSNKRRIAAAILCACFVLRLTSYAVSRDGLYFVAVENMMAPLTEDTMPFWNNGYLYISADIFTGNIRDALGISRAKIGDGVLLYRGEQSLLFREGYPYAQDSQEATYTPGMIWHDGGAYVPASVVARYFNLTYSTVSVKYGHLVWLRSAAFKMDDKAFAKAAEFQMNAAYEEYLRSLEPEEEASETPPDEEPEAWGEWEALPEWDPEGAEPDEEGGLSALEEPDAPDTSAPTTTPVAPSNPAPTPVAPSNPAPTPVAPSNPAPTPVTPSNPTTKPVTPSNPTTKPATPSAPATTPVAPSAPAPTPVAPSNPAPTPVAPSAPATTEPAAPSNPAATTEPVTPPAPTVTEPAPPEIGGGQNIYLCLRGDDNAADLLDALDRHGIRAAVFCGENFLSEQGDLLRRIAATGHQIGLYVAARPSASAVLEELEARNEQLRRVTMEKTRLVCADGAGETLLRALRNAGYLCPRPTLDRSAAPLRTSRQATDLLAAVSQQSGSVTVWLGGTVNRSGLNAFVNDALEVGDAFPTPYEAAFF